ncbi:A disintegrin and metalloproteinase with thrombospondin motifs adt-1 [Anopheles cruzii]|uniref:A disintegrin and metalloproteinase with thrombospondin motifs adt-1 n=1 Tax=Anopheles cruzii TaxID=68878 RepID=UPI0022EC6320|nr:A disintegrin and metalloproteinase with thrombospondin motifs adt-1 [Anopheles cruzii]
MCRRRVKCANQTVVGTTVRPHIVAFLVIVTVLMQNSIVCIHLDIERVDYLILNNIKVDEKNLYKYIDKHEQLMLFGGSPKDDFTIVSVHQRKREARSWPGTGHLHFNMGGTGYNFSLQLQKSDILIDDSFVFLQHYDNSTVLLDDSYDRIMRYKDCFYRNERAAFDLCEGNVRGLVRSNETNIIIHPLPERFGKSAHILLNKDKLQDTASISEIPVAPQPHGRRHKRQLDSISVVPDVLHIETAIFIDKDLYRHMMKNYPKNTEGYLVRFILTMINGVQILYNHPSLGHTINFILKRLEILHNDPTDLRRSIDIDIYLNSFCGWQRKLNPVSDADPVHFDHAIILTGLDLFVVNKNGKSSNQVVGLAPVSGMCTASQSCTLNEGKHFESVFVVSHEIGHNLGMRHDTSENNCDPSLYIMSPTLGSGKTTWSSCSRNYLNAFLKTSQATCLFDRGHYELLLDHTREGKLPGERFDADQQCLLKYGKDSVRSKTQELTDICRDLHCQRDRYTWTSHPALEGTSCGKAMWCRSGVCTPKITSLSVHPNGQRITAFKTIDKKTFLEGIRLASLKQDLSKAIKPTWSQWNDPTECVSGCLYGESGRLKEGSTGLREFTRTCLDKRQHCSGSSRKYETCLNKQCYNIARITVSEFSNQICGRAQEFDADIIGYGLQKAVLDAEDACKVFCATKSGTPKSKSWIYPDGTKCQLLDTSQQDTYYCVSGRCELFDCNNTTNNYYRLHSMLCPSSYDVERISNSIYRENHRDYKEFRLTQKSVSTNQISERMTTVTERSGKPNGDGYFTDHYNARDAQALHSTRLSELESRNLSREVKSACYFGCVEDTGGIQLVTTSEGSARIKLCNVNTIACDSVVSMNEFATQLCKRYQKRVRGLSGNGMQIAATVANPDRSCRIACQDLFLSHRFYFVNGEQGLFPVGSRCNHNQQNRYCVNGKCLLFGNDGMPVNDSVGSLPTNRIRRSATQSNKVFEYFVTKQINLAFMKALIVGISQTYTGDDTTMEDGINFGNPVDLLDPVEARNGNHD